MYWYILLLDFSLSVILKPYIVNCPKDLYSVAVIPLLEFVCPYFYQVSLNFIYVFDIARNIKIISLFFFDAFYALFFFFIFRN